MKKRTLAYLVALALCLAPAQAFAAAPRMPVIFDVLVARPLGFVGLVVSTVAFGVSTPFIAVVPGDGRVSDAYVRMVREPAEFVFWDPIGSH